MNCVHLDFHTSPDIEGIGERFDRKQFIDTIKKANVDLMTVFAKCHHGYTYYPSRVGKMHPHLKFNLLKEQLEAIREAGAKAPIYIPIGWSKLDSDEHPEWRQIVFETGKPLSTGAYPKEENPSPDMPLGDCAWENLCPSGEYLDYLVRLTEEICESFDASDGVFYDICFFGKACACDNCKKGMKKAGLNPESLSDAEEYYRQSHIHMMKTLTATVQRYYKNAPVFYNGGADMNRTEYHQYQTHFELEDLPTAWGGYDLMPLRAKFFEKYGKLVWGMTGKFHHSWGEFGGFKNKQALLYECADMLSVGVSASVGDHLHPLGMLEDSTYKVIGHAFDYTKKIEKYCFNTKAYTDIALWLSHVYNSDVGASKVLQEMQLEYDVIENGEELSKYKLVVLPDHVKLGEKDKAQLLSYVKAGGKIVASYESVFCELGIKKLEPSGCDKDFIKCDLGDFNTPFLSYSSAYKTEVTDKSARVRAQVFEPYFSRTVGHFCGHKNTPYRPEAADYPALTESKNLLYFAHPVFDAYNYSGSYVLEKYIEEAIESFYDKQLKVENLPSSGRVRIREAKDGSFLGLHLLYAPPVNRGIACVLPDFPTLHGVRVTLDAGRKIKSVSSEPDGTNLPFEANGNTVSFEIPPFNTHKLIVLK